NACKLTEAPAHLRLVFLNHRARGVIRLSNLHGGIGQGASPRIRATRLLYKQPEKSLDLCPRVALILGNHLVPPFPCSGLSTTQTFGHEVILRGEVTIE